MKPCPFCGAPIENESAVLCPSCKRPAKEFLTSGAPDAARKDGDGWPHSEEGTPEEAAILMTVPDGFGGEVALSLLRAFEIPFVLQYPIFGRLTRVYAGISMAGVDVYVPGSLLGTAVELLNAPPDISEEDIRASENEK